MAYQVGKSGLQNSLEAIGFEFSLAKSQMALLVAIVFLAVSGGMYWQQKARADWRTAEGRVTGLTTRTDANNETRYVGVISYTVNGQSYSIQGDTSTVWRPHTGGTKQLIYNPQDPSKASVKMSNAWRWIFIVAFPVTGSFLLLYAFLGLIFSRR